MQRKISAAAVLVAAAAIALTGCSANQGASSASSDKTLTWSVWAGSEAETASWQHIADMVHQQYPHLTVKLQTSSWGDYWTKMPSLLAGSSAPCVVGMSADYVTQFGNLVVPLKDQVKSAGINLSDFNQGMLSTLSDNGTLIGVPYDMGPRFIYYNKDAFAKAGLSAPKNGWTVPEFEAAAQKLTGSGKYGFAVANTLDDLTAWAPTIAGTQPATSDAKLNIDTAGMKKTLTWYGSLVNKLHVAPPLSATTTSTPQGQFLAGNAAMYMSGAFDMVNIKAQAKFKVGTVTLPVGPAGQKSIDSGSGFSVAKRCTDQADAIKALSVITGTKALTYLGQKGRAFPARPALWNTWYQNAVPGAKETLEMALQKVVPQYGEPTWTQDSNNYAQGVVAVINGEAGSNVDKFLADIQSSSQSAK